MIFSAGPEQKRDLAQILSEIRVIRAPGIKADIPAENKTRLRLNRALDRLEKQVIHIAANRLKLRNADFKTLWLKMQSVEGRSVAFPELLMQILEMPYAELLKKSQEIGLVVAIPPSSDGCCAIEGYYKFIHEKITAMPDEIILAFRSRLYPTHEKPAKGLHHGIMIEMVDRGYYESYNGYACIHNKVTGCRITAE